MKTPISKLIEAIQNMHQNTGCSLHYSDVISLMEKALEEEKEAISTAYENGAYDFQLGEHTVTSGDGIDYYNKEYK